MVDDRVLLLCCISDNDNAQEPLNNECLVKGFVDPYGNIETDPSFLDERLHLPILFQKRSKSLILLGEGQSGLDEEISDGDKGGWLQAGQHLSRRPWAP